MTKCTRTDKIYLGKTQNKQVVISKNDTTPGPVSATGRGPEGVKFRKK